MPPRHDEIFIDGSSPYLSFFFPAFQSFFTGDREEETSRNNKPKGGGGEGKADNDDRKSDDCDPREWSRDDPQLVHFSLDAVSPSPPLPSRRIGVAI